jgi:hypothetical protein
MKRHLALAALCVLVAACSSSGSAKGNAPAPNAKRVRVAIEESSRLQRASVPLSTYGRFELAPMKLGAEVSADERKVKEAKRLEERLAAALAPTLTEWNARGGDPGKVLRIEPKLMGLHVVSGGARFWAGGMAGESSIDMDLDLVDVASGHSVAKPRIQRNSGAMAGGWSVGATDRNLADYIVEIAHQYLLSNYE